MLDISEERVNKPRYLNKETLAKNILQGVWKLEDLRELDWAIRMTYQANSKTFEKAKDRMEKLHELYVELIDDPVKFVEKYDKKTPRHIASKILKENPNIFKSKEIYKKE